MRVVVTGSSGHIGGATARHLYEQGHEVIGISRSHAAALPDAIMQLSLDIGSEAFTGAARDAIKHCDAFIHAAACLDEDENNTAISRVNCLGTQQALVLAKELGTHTFIYISGLNLLGIPVELPVTECHPVNPLNRYAASKLYGEYLSVMASASQFRCVAFRVSSPVGPGLVNRRIFRIFIEKALQGEPLVVHGSGTRRQDYVDVRDVAHVIATTISLRTLPAEVFNIAAGRSVSNWELAELCVASLGSKSEVYCSGEDDPLDAVSWDISISKAGRLLGYAPQYSLHTSITDLAQVILNGE